MSAFTEGKTVVITGSTGGIGFYSAQEIARLGAYVVIIGRDEAHVDAAVETLKQETGNAMIERIVGDVFTLQGVQDLATTIGQRAPEMDLLINNSGYIGNTLVHNADGIEMHFAVTSGQYQGSRPFGSGFLLPHHLHSVRFLAIPPLRPTTHPSAVTCSRFTDRLPRPVE